MILIICITQKWSKGTVTLLLVSWIWLKSLEFMICFYLHWPIDRVCVCPELKEINPVIPQNSLELWESSMCKNNKKKIIWKNTDIRKRNILLLSSMLWLQNLQRELGYQLEDNITTSWLVKWDQFPFYKGTLYQIYFSTENLEPSGILSNSNLYFFVASQLFWEVLSWMVFLWLVCGFSFKAVVSCKIAAFFFLLTLL